MQKTKKSLLIITLIIASLILPFAMPTLVLAADAVTTEAPEATPETTPEATPEATPETTPETTPEATPETTPETTPEATPETTPETTPVLTSVTYSLSGDFFEQYSEKYIPLTANNIKLVAKTYTGTEVDIVEAQKVQSVKIENESIATLDSKTGNITPKAIGSTRIIIGQNEYTYPLCTITVTDQSMAEIINSTNGEIKAYEKYNFTDATDFTYYEGFTPYSFAFKLDKSESYPSTPASIDYTYVSSNPDCISVDQYGVVTFGTVGTAKVDCYFKSESNILLKSFNFTIKENNVDNYSIKLVGDRVYEYVSEYATILYIEKGSSAKFLNEIADGEYEDIPNLKYKLNYNQYENTFSWDNGTLTALEEGNPYLQLFGDDFSKYVQLNIVENLEEAIKNCNSKYIEVEKDLNELDEEALQNEYGIYAAMYDEEGIVSSTVFEQLKDNELPITISTELADWEFDSENIDNTDIDFMPYVKISEEKFEGMESDRIEENALFLDFAHEGALPGTAKVTIYVPSEFANLVGEEDKTIYLYYYNPDKEDYEFVSEANYTAKYHKVTFELSHCSQYALVDEKIEGVPDRKLDNEPKAGETTFGAMFASIIAFTSFAGVVICKKIKK